MARPRPATAAESSARGRGYAVGLTTISSGIESTIFRYTCDGQRSTQFITLSDAARRAGLSAAADTFFSYLIVASFYYYFIIIIIIIVVIVVVVVVVVYLHQQMHIKSKTYQYRLPTKRATVNTISEEKQQLK